MKLKKLLDEAGDVLLTRMISIQRGSTDTSIALREVVKFHFKLGSDQDDSDVWYVAAHHWSPSLISKNYEGSKGNRCSRQFKSLLTRYEACSHDFSMGEHVNNFQSCLNRAGVSIESADKRRLLIVQAPINPLSSVKSYFEGITSDRAVRLRSRIYEEQQREPLAVPEAVSAASPLVATVAPSPPITPSLGTYHNYIKQHYNSNKMFPRPKFLECFQMLRTYYDNFDAIECSSDPQVFLFPCRGDPRSEDCQKYGSRSRLLSTTVFCANCGKREAKSRRAQIVHQKIKFEDTNGKRTAANSATSFKNLSPGEKDARMSSLAKERRKYRRTTQRLRKGLESNKSKFKLLDCASDFRSLITSAFRTLASFSTDEKAEVKQYIIKELVGLSAGAAWEKVNDEEACDFAAYLMTEMDNKGKELAGKPSTVEFTPAIYQSAVVLYLHSKVGYNDQRKLSPLVMPSPTTMNRLLRETRLNEGYSPKIYGNFFDEYVTHKSPVIGQLVFDEMKLKTGVFWRTSDHTVCGFASANHNSTIRTILSDMIENGDDGTDEFHDMNSPAVYVNQWRFRSIYNVIHNSNFFFNSGSLGMSIRGVIFY